MAGMAINSWSEEKQDLMTCLQYENVDDTSTKLYGPRVAKPRWLDERQQHVWQSYLHVNQHLYATLEERLVRDAGLSAADYKVLVPLSETLSGVLRARELGAEIGWDRSRLSHHIRRMEERGLVIREECAEDGRGTMVRLTAAGRRAIEGAAPGHAEDVHRYFFDLLSKKEVETLGTILDRVLENLTQRNA
jgi:DNA-binding MarR family transcriptional regulator